MSTTLKDALATEYVERLRWHRHNATVRHGLMPTRDYERPVEIKDPPKPKPPAEKPPVKVESDKDAAPFPGPGPDKPGKPGPVPDAGKDGDQPQKGDGCNWSRLILASLPAAALTAATLGTAIWLSQPSITVEPKTPPNLLQSLEDKGYNVP